MAPKDLGSMGYAGVASLYIPQHIQNAAYVADAEPLEYFRAYNASRKTPWRYFDSPRDIDTSRLLPCTATNLMDSRMMKEYAEITGDAEGVVVDGNITKGRCFDSLFLVFPSMSSGSRHVCGDFYRRKWMGIPGIHAESDGSEYAFGRSCCI